jgi:uncharacterized protein (DUF302 family)
VKLLRLLALFAILVAAPLHADELLIVRTEQPFPEAMARLQDVVAAHGYKVTRVQRVDVGLTSSGYTTAEYRVVFFARPEELRRLPDGRPELLAYLPLKIVIFAEGESTLALTNSPALLSEFFTDAALRVQFQRWERDVRSILDQFAAH